MKDTINIVRAFTVALMPIALLLFVGSIEEFIRLDISQNYQMTYRYISIPVYALIGLIFAFSIFCDKEFFKRGSAVIAHIFAGVSVVAFFVLWLYWWIAPASIDGILNEVFRLVPVNIMSLVLGYTLFSSIRAITLFIKSNSASIWNY